MTDNHDQTFVIPDGAERERAATTFDRNVVVTAGAGTGKTTLLVDRFVHLLMREPDPLPVGRILALTFTNKAAGEMRLRVRERLQALIASRPDQESDPAAAGAQLRDLIERYRLSKDEVDRRAHEALRQLDRSSIATLHSFAAWLLRLYPTEAGVDPRFEEDDGRRLRRHFEEQWAVRLGQDLGLQARDSDAWTCILTKLPLETVATVAFSLCAETIPIASLREPEEPARQLRDWLAEQLRVARELLERHPEDRHQIDHSLRRCLTVLEAASAGPAELRRVGEKLRHAPLVRPQPAGSWSEADGEILQEIWRVARGLLEIDLELTAALWQVLVPFAAACRASFVRAGFLSFDGLLARARDLLRDRPPVRAELKNFFRAILIDEFQDTDPIQYEIVLYLGEKDARCAPDWRSVELQPGKTFIVGDPKQSIYAFRRADIQGYLEVVRDIILARGGIECALTANFRSHPEILRAINGVFERLIRERPGLQPDYVPIRSPRSKAEADCDPEPPVPRVLVRRVICEEKLNATAARRLEAESLARWLHEAVLGKLRIRVPPDGEITPAQPRHVAFLFRKLTDVHLYLEPLRLRKIPYVVEGERHFYATQEIVDVINLLRAIDNPCDQTALAGLLRSPIGGLSDRDLHRLQRAGFLDYRTIRRVTSEVPEIEPARQIYTTLDRLHHETRTLPVVDAVDQVFHRIPVRILAARSFDGEQALGNLEKIRQQAAILARERGATLKSVVARLERRVLELEQESESNLAEEGVDAVKILSVHKAKGLEFPLVVLPDAGSGGGSERVQDGVQFDWASTLVGLRAPGHRNLAAVYLDQLKRRRESEEQKRVFYVAMTRAREHLVISCSPTRTHKDSFLGMLEASVGKLGPIPTPRAAVRAGAGTLQIEVVTETLRPPRGAESPDAGLCPDPDWGGFAENWQRRAGDFDRASRTPMFVSPSTLQRREYPAVTRDALPPRSAALDPLVVGAHAHRFLETVDFGAKRADLERVLVRYVERQSPEPSGPDATALLEELQSIFHPFFGSTIWRELASSTILGREIPLLMARNGQIVEGMIDVLYERQGRLYVADYKTDRVGGETLGKVAERYREQGSIYVEAVRRALKRAAVLKVIFLRHGEAVELAGPQPQGVLEHEHPIF